MHMGLFPLIKTDINHHHNNKANSISNTSRGSAGRAEPLKSGRAPVEGRLCRFEITPHGLICNVVILLRNKKTRYSDKFY